MRWAHRARYGRRCDDYDDFDEVVLLVLLLDEPESDVDVVFVFSEPELSDVLVSDVGLSATVVELLDEEPERLSFL